jgi:iron complex transport system substrate-binding protein
MVILAGCVAAPAAPALQTTVAQAAVEQTPAATMPPAAQAADAFPAKAELRHAKAFTVEYHDTYKLLTVLQPWRDAGRTFTYVLVQRGTQPPADIGEAQVVEIPIQSAASLSTTHLPYWDELGQLDLLKAVGNSIYVNNPGVLERLQSGKIVDVGNGPEVNIETLLALGPEIITTTALGNTRKDDYLLLQDKGFKVVVVSDFMEEIPLGRAEWVKFMALFTNQEARAEEVFAGIEKRYRDMQNRAQNASGCPTVVLGYEINGAWNMPGGKSYQAAYIRDAGGCYLWADDDTTGRIPLSFEAVYEKAADAEYWFNQSSSWRTAADVLAADPRYEKFRAFTEGHTYNNNARVNATGGNDYNESGHANPDLVLADLIAILHPELLPDHTLVYHRLLDPGGRQK